jgi:hypothetical protein
MTICLLKTHLSDWRTARMALVLPEERLNKIVLTRMLLGNSNAFEGVKVW